MPERIEELNEALGDRYRVEREVGAGGMNTVYLAQDLKHDRQVAVKVFHLEVSSSVGHERFLREVQISARLNHPHILTLIDSGQVGDLLYYVMPYVEGESLRQRIEREGPLDVEEAVGLIGQITAALDYAHGQGVIHRDIKPENILIHRGEAMVSDFGIAIGLESAKTGRLTATGTLLGTPFYMSPEQVESDADLDVRSDIYALGCVAHEMLAGEPPFTGTSAQVVLAKILTADPTTLSEVREDVSAEAAEVIVKALARAPEDRFATAGDFGAALHDAILGSLADAGRGRGSDIKWTIAAASIAVLGWQLFRPRGSDASVDSALAEIDQTLVEGNWIGTWRLAAEIEDEASDSTMERVWAEVSSQGTIVSDPEGASVSWRAFNSQEDEWEPLGVTPLEARLARPPNLNLHALALYLELDGYESRIVGWTRGLQDVPWKLQPLGGEVSDVVHVPARTVRLGSMSPELWAAPAKDVGEYMLDKYEVTNAAYQAFVEAGGYERPEYWEHEFEKDGRPLTWEEARAEFVDRTGRPGPSTWEIGGYPPGTEDHPVTGVSWYEAAAYARWSGRSLPTLYHWYGAAYTNLGAFIIPNSNLDGDGLAAVGEHRAVTPVGAYDMAENAREWVLNADQDLRYIVGGGWNDSGFYFNAGQQGPPFDRSPTNGFRLMTDLGDPDAFSAAGEPINRAVRDFSLERPVSDEVFEFFRSSFDYDHTALNALIERVDTVPAGIRERITFDAAYGDERMILYFFLPPDAEPPLQTVLYMPNSGALLGGGIDDFSEFSDHASFLVRSGRAVAFPVYKSMWDREDDYRHQNQDPSNDHRDHVIQWRMDLGRSLDYLETREDLDPGGVSYFGYSWGGRTGVIMLAVEPRFKAGVLYTAGFSLRQTQQVVEPLNYAPRIRVPVLMLSGQYDHIYPLAQSRPLFELLGTDEKEQFIAPGGHFVPHDDLIRESLRWLDTYVGPVR